MYLQLVTDTSVCHHINTVLYEQQTDKPGVSAIVEIQLDSAAAAVCWEKLILEGREEELKPSGFLAARVKTLKWSH